RGSNSIVSKEIRAIVVDHVINHGMTMTEAATMIQPNLRRSTVASIIRTFRNENREAPYQPARHKTDVAKEKSAAASASESISTACQRCISNRSLTPLSLPLHSNINNFKTPTIHSTSFLFSSPWSSVSGKYDLSISLR
ncbi:hypothetical protein DPX16_17622, partial [Anabarilius grahami]